MNTLPSFSRVLCAVRKLLGIGHRVESKSRETTVKVCSRESALESRIFSAKLLRNVVFYRFHCVVIKTHTFDSTRPISLLFSFLFTVSLSVPFLFLLKSSLSKVDLPHQIEHNRDLHNRETVAQTVTQNSSLTMERA